MALWLLLKRSARTLLSAMLSHVYQAPGIYLGHGSRIRGGRHITFGRGFYAQGNLWLEAISNYREQDFDPHISLGDRVCFSNGVHVSCADRISIQSDVLVGSHVYISDHGHGCYRGAAQSSPDEPPASRRLVGGPVDIGRGVWIGDNAVIVGPVTIGDGAVIGANSVIKCDVAPRTIVAGIPARVIRAFQETSQTWDRA
jgi:lipopolysaccharide O-acetyltransferase